MKFLAKLLLLLALPCAALAQTWPSKPVHLVVTFAAGGGADFIARAVAPKLGEGLGQSIVVENKAGANGTIGADAVAKAAPDGYTLLVGAAGTMVVAPHLMSNMPFDTFKAFAPVALLADSPFVVAVNPSVKANSIKELIALAKASPKKLNFGSSGVGGSPHLAGELFKRMAGVDMIHVAYKGLAPAITDLLGGQIQLIFADVGLVAPHLASGRLRGLAVTGSQRSGTLPALPTVAEAGVPGYAAGTWYGVFAPAGTPPAIVARVSADIHTALAQPELHRMIASKGNEPVGSNPAQFADFLRAEYDKWGQLIREAKITIN